MTRATLVLHACTMGTKAEVQLQLGLTKAVVDMHTENVAGMGGGGGGGGGMRFSKSLGGTCPPRPLKCKLQIRRKN